MKLLQTAMVSDLGIQFLLLICSMRLKVQLPPRKA